MTTFTTSLTKGENSFDTAKKAAEEANNKLHGMIPNLCIVFSSMKYDLRDVVKGVRSVIGNTTQIIGCSSSGEFTEEAVDKHSISIGLLSSNKYTFKVAGATGLKENAEELFMGLQEDLKGFIDTPGETSAIMFMDGLAGNGEEASLIALGTFAAQMNIVGGAAGDDLAFQSTQVIANDDVLDDGISVCIVKGENQLFSGVKHGHKPITEPLIATKAEGNVLYTVNDRPAWDVWKEQTKDNAHKIGIDVDTISENTDVGSFLIRFELGLATKDGFKIRVPLSKNADGSLNFACTVPQGATFRIMESVKEDQIRSAREAAEIAKTNVGNKKIVGIIVFDCICRAIILGDRFSEAIDAIKDVAGKDIPLLGFETYGEICMNPTQFSGFHNTTTVLAFITE